jgi:hypothetical protein
MMAPSAIGSCQVDVAAAAESNSWNWPHAFIRSPLLLQWAFFFSSQVPLNSINVLVRAQKEEQPRAGRERFVGMNGRPTDLRLDILIQFLQFSKRPLILPLVLEQIKSQTFSMG